MSDQTVKREIEFDGEKAKELYNLIGGITESWGWSTLQTYAHLRSLVEFMSEEIGVESFRTFDEDGEPIE